MSYDFYIGEAVPTYPSENNGFFFGWHVEKTEQVDAPEWDCIPDKFGGVDVSGKTNGRHPSYGGHYEFIKVTKTEKLWDELLSEHPGICLLTSEHETLIMSARKAWETDNPDAIPGWNEGEDPILARLLWYEWWIRWALKNCEYPAIENY